MFVTEHYQGKEKAVPDRYKMQQKDGSQGRRHQAQANCGKDSQVPSAIHTGSIQQFAGDSGIRINACEPDTEGTEKRWEQDRPVGIGEMHSAHQEIEREDQHRSWHQNRTQQYIKDQFFATEGIFCQGIPAQRSDYNTDARATCGVEKGIAHPLHIDPAIVGQQLLHIREKIEAVGKPERRRSIEIGITLR